MRNLIFLSLTVIFVSHSVCTEQQSPPSDAKPQQPAGSMPIILLDNKDAPVTQKEQAANNPAATQGAPAVNTNQAATTANQSPTTGNQAATPTNEAATNQSVPTPQKSTEASNATPQNALAPDQTATKPNEAKSDVNNKETADKPTENATKKTEDQVVPSKAANETKPAVTDKAENGTKPAPKENATTVIPKNEPEKTTKAPEDKQVLATRAFDGASFVGGIVLTLGLLAVSFVGFKYYKNLTKENYHIL